MDDNAGALERRIAADALIAVRCLAAAERAVDEGRLNLAKVLRAQPLAARQRALALERIASRAVSASAIAHELAAAASVATDAGGADSLVDREVLAVVDRNAAAARSIVLKTADALAKSRDVPESIVPQFLFGCGECGYISDVRAEVCSSCGSVGGDFELFAPFFSATNERIARRQPQQIVSMLRQAPADLADAFDRAPEGALSWRPAEGEWCMKEIAGHMIDIAELFCRRVAPVVDPAAKDPGDAMVLPWKILEGRGYDELVADEITSRFASQIEHALDLIARIDPADWRKPARMLGSRVSLIDMGSWLANHNVAHREQIIARIGEHAAATAEIQTPIT